MSCPFAPTRSPPCSHDSSPVSLSFPPDCDGGRVAVVTLRRPDSLNALGAEALGVFIEAVTWCGEQEHIVATVLTGQGRFFSAGADVKDPQRNVPDSIASLPDSDPNKHTQLRRFYAARIAVTNGALASVFMNHPKLLVGAMNGPAVGILACAVAHCDLLYSFKEFWLATPFSSLALVSEGLASKTFVQRMGLGRAKLALLQGKRMLAPDLHTAGFISEIFYTPSPPLGTSERDKHYTPPILVPVLERLRTSYLPPTLDPWALLQTKRLINRAAYENVSSDEASNAELRGAEAVFLSGRPQARFADIAAGARHKM